MREKGFTLSELLGVIVIIGLLLILIVPTILNRLNSTGDEATGAGNEIIYNAADQYIREHPKDYPPGKAGRYCIAIQKLIDDGKLSAPVKDVTTGEDISDKSVMVTIYSAGTSDYEIKNGSECSELSSMPFIDFEVTPKGSSWVPKRTVKIIWPATDGDYQVRYRVDNGDWQYVNINSKTGGTTELVFDKSAASRPLQAQYIGKGGNTSTDNIINSKINIVNVDSIPPTCTLRKTGTVGDNSWYRSNVTIDFGNNNANLQDDLSGVADYGISTSNTNTFGKISSKVQTADIANITYYGFVKDKAGNIGMCNTSLKKDATKPTCSMTESGTKGTNNWYTSNVTFNVTNNDNLSGVASYGLTTSSSATYNSKTSATQTGDTKSVTYYGYVKDKAGNTNSCSRTVKKDGTKPTCSVNRSNTWTTSGVNFSYSCSDSTSGVVSCPANKNGQKRNVAAVTIKDKAGNTNTCAAQTVSSQTQYRRATRGDKTCTNSTCCGGYYYEYNCGSYCSQYACRYYWIGDTQGGGPGYRTLYYSSCPSRVDNYWHLMSSSCNYWKTNKCQAYQAYTCTNSCCGYTGWSGWSGWSAGNYCNSNYCKSESRVVYY